MWLHKVGELKCTTIRIKVRVKVESIPKVLCVKMSEDKSEKCPYGCDSNCNEEHVWRCEKRISAYKVGSIADLVEQILLLGDIGTLTTARDVNELWRCCSDYILNRLKKRCLEEIPAHYLNEFLSREEFKGHINYGSILKKWLTWKDMANIDLRVDMKNEATAVIVRNLPHYSGTATSTITENGQNLLINDQSVGYYRVITNFCFQGEFLYVLSNKMLMKGNLNNYDVLYYLQWHVFDVAVFDGHLFILYPDATTNGLVTLHCMDTGKTMELTTGGNPFYCLSDIYKIYGPDLIVGVYYDLFGEQIFQVCIYKDHRSLQDVWPILLGTIVKIFRYGRIFIVGLSSGRLYFYDVEDWKTFDLRKSIKHIDVEGSIANIDVDGRSTEWVFVVITSAKKTYYITGECSCYKTVECLI